MSKISNSSSLAIPGWLILKLSVLNLNTYFFLPWNLNLSKLVLFLKRPKLLLLPCLAPDQIPGWNLHTNVKKTLGIKLKVLPTWEGDWSMDGLVFWAHGYTRYHRGHAQASSLISLLWASQSSSTSRGPRRTSTTFNSKNSLSLTKNGPWRPASFQNLPTCKRLLLHHTVGLTTQLCTAQ